MTTAPLRCAMPSTPCSSFSWGRDAPDEDKEAIVAFIKTLAGESKELSQ